MTLSDRYKEPLSPRLEEQAQNAAQMLRHRDGSRPDAALLLGYLQNSVAHALARPPWKSRDRLAVDLRAVTLAWETKR